MTTAELPIVIEPWQAAVERLASKTPVASRLNTEEWSRFPLAIRERAIWSATLAQANVIQQLKDDLIAMKSMQTVDGRAMDRSRIVERARATLRALPGDTDDLTDLTSFRRLQLIVDFQEQDANGYARYKSDLADPDILDAQPAYRFIRIEQRDSERLDWPRRWAAAYAAVGGQGALQSPMVALKTSPIWAALSRFGRPWPPFDFGSGMGIAGVDRFEAEDLGLLTPNDSLDGPAAIQDFNDGVQASAKNLDPQTRSWIQSAIGDIAQFIGDQSILLPTPSTPSTSPSTPPSTPAPTSTPSTPETIRQQVAAAPDDAAARRLIELPPAQRGKIQHLKPPTPALKPWADAAVPILEAIIAADRLPQVRFKTSRAKRAKYTSADRTVHVHSSGGRKLTTDQSVSLSLIHEMVHDIEVASPHILQATQNFLNARAARNLNTAGTPSRVTLYGGGTAFEDEWTTRGNSIYTGRIYQDATEILTMGLERLIEQPKTFAQQDPEYFQFILQTLQQ